VSPARLRSRGTGESVARYCCPWLGGEREGLLRLKPGGLSTDAGAGGLTRSSGEVPAGAVGMERRGQVIRGLFARSTGRSPGGVVWVS